MGPECRHQDEREVQVSCHQPMVRHSRGPRPPPEVPPRSEESSRLRGMSACMMNNVCCEGYKSFAAKPGGEMNTFFSAACCQLARGDFTRKFQGLLVCGAEARIFAPVRQRFNYVRLLA